MGNRIFGDDIIAKRRETSRSRLIQIFVYKIDFVCYDYRVFGMELREIRENVCGSFTKCMMELKNYITVIITGITQVLCALVYFQLHFLTFDSSISSLHISPYCPLHPIITSFSLCQIQNLFANLSISSR